MKLASLMTFHATVLVCISYFNKLLIATTDYLSITLVALLCHAQDHFPFIFNNGCKSTSQQVDLTARPEVSLGKNYVHVITTCN